MPELTVLVVGASGSVGRHVVAQSLQAGHHTRALIRDQSRAANLPAETETVIGDLTSTESLRDAVDGVNAIVFTHGSHGGAEAAEAVDYGAVRNILMALGSDQAPRIALMTTIGVTKHTVGHDWKRRGERLVRASGLPYTIVRPGWFDYNDPDQHQPVMLQGDRRWAGDPSDGVIARAQIAQVLLASLTSPGANRKTFELVAEHGPSTDELEGLFSSLASDTAEELDGVQDRANMPLQDEPPAVIAQLDEMRARRSS